MKSIFPLLAAASACIGAPSLAADWNLAESDHFRVYSDDTAEATEAYAADLERLDEAMAVATGNVDKDAKSPPPSSKVTVYRFGETSDIANLYGARDSGVAGFFMPRAGNSVAFVPRRDDNARGLGAKKSVFSLDPKAILFHEYTHYFMFQHGAAAYPAWYVEGMAELFGTLQINQQNFVIGEPPIHRGYELSEMKIELKSLLDPPKKMTRLDVARTYAIGWLLTSHLTFDPRRKGQLGKYLRLYNSGAAPLDAATQAFGDLDVLEAELDTYRHSAARILKVSYAAAAEPKVSVRALSPDETARMAMAIQSNRGVTKEKANKQVPEARALVERFPESPAVLTAATEVEFDAGNFGQAETLAGRALKKDPENVDAAIYLARVAMKRAKTDPAQYSHARRLFIAANKIVNDHPVPLAGYYLAYVLAGETPSSDAVAALDGAFAQAPFDPYLRRAEAHRLLVEGEDAQAMIVLGPLLNGAHVANAGKLRDLVAKLKEGERQPLIDELAPKVSDDEEKKEDKGGDGGEGEGGKKKD